MGFWDSVKNVANKVVTATTNFINKAKETVTTVIHNVFGRKDEKIQNISNQVSTRDSYNQYTASVKETMDLNRELEKYSSSFKDESTQFEEFSLEYYKECYEEFLSEIEKIQGQEFHSIKIEFPIAEIKREMRNKEIRIKGTIRKELNKRFALNDDECYEILEMDPGREKNQRMERFGKMVLREALDKMALSLKETAETQGEKISSLLEGTLDQVAKAVANQAMLFDEIEKAKNADEMEMEAIKNEIAYTIQICDFSLNQLEDVNKQIPA